SSLMKPAREKLWEHLKVAKVREFQTGTAYIPNIYAEIKTSHEDVLETLSRQITDSVKWRQSLEALDQRGFEIAYEIGPGKVLSGLMAKTLNKTLYSVSNLESLKVLK